MRRSTATRLTAGEVLAHLRTHSIDVKTKVQPPNAPAASSPKDQFGIDLDTVTVTCPNGTTVPIRPVRGHNADDASRCDQRVPPNSPALVFKVAGHGICQRFGAVHTGEFRSWTVSPAH
jgi:hypothetical protein